MALVLAGAALVAVPASAPPSQAASRYLCTGYTACANAGYGHAGYAQVNRTMFWRMYAGHNCTNYVAYRMIKAGLPTTRPWTGSGMAYNWGKAMARITDKTPAVGSVAWFDRGVGGAGSSGHVAYVEKVVSPTEIVISEDSWSGDFHWRTITKTGSSWPTGFIHFADIAPAPVPVIAATAAPKITGAPQIGLPLAGTPATFAPADVTHHLQWFVGGVGVPGATAATYAPTAADTGKTVVLRDIAVRAGYANRAAFSAATPPVTSGSLVRVAKPTIAGSAEVGQVLTAVAGQWSPPAESVVYRWRADGVWMQGRNGPTLTVGNDLVGKKISVVEVAKRAGYASLGNASVDTAPVVAGVVELTTPFRASGTARVGSALAFTPGTWAPADAAATYEWFRDGVVVPGLVGPSYPLGVADAGHRVTVRATVARNRFRGFTRSADYGVVTTPSAMTVKPLGRRGAAVAQVRVSAPGVAAPTGTIWARIGTKVVRGSVVDGVARLKLTKLRRGTKSMFVLYAGNGVVEEARQTVRVVVKPKRR